MFIGTDPETHRAASQKLMEAAVYLRRASDSLMAVQSMFVHEEYRQRVQKIRQQTDIDAIWLDSKFQMTVEMYFK